MTRAAIQTLDAPQAIGPYSQAVRAGDLLFLSGQIPLDPANGELVTGSIEAQARRVLDNLLAVARAGGSDLDRVVKLTVYLTDLSHFAAVNAVMAGYFQAPYPARAVLGVAALPRGATLEIEAVCLV
ncbi:MAG TPA: RidA family protein [Candidatus Macondimonas sp.]|nr:RidA family protein [Candidatus Macondimonas sp.]